MFGVNKENQEYQIVGTQMILRGVQKTYNNLIRQRTA